MRSRENITQPNTKIDLLLSGTHFESDSQIRFAAWHLPDGHGFYHHDRAESARLCKLRSSYFEDVAFDPPIKLTAFAGDGEPHDIKIIATDDHGHTAEAWISGKDFYRQRESGVVA